MYSVAQYRGLYRRHLGPLAQSVTLMVNNGTDFDHYPVTAHVSNWVEGDLVPGATVETADLRLIIPAEDIPSGLRDLEQRDRVDIDGRQYAVMQWDTHTRSIGGTLMAVEARVRG